MAGQGDVGADFTEQYRAVLRRSEYASAMLKNLEDRRKRLISSLVDRFAGAATKAEHHARCQPGVEELDDLIAAARIEAGESHAEATWYSARLELWRTRQSTFREQMKMNRGQDNDR